MIDVAIKDIIVPEGRRPLDPAKVAEIAASIKAVGLLSPIGVDLKFYSEVPEGFTLMPYTLVWGAHRLEACHSLGWEKIAVIDVSAICEDDEDATIKMMEIAENLHRAELTTQQRNEHLAEWVTLLEKRPPPISDAEQPISSKPGRKPSRAVASVAKISGLTTKTVKEAIKSTKVSLAVKAAADNAELTQKQRLAIARLPENKQIEAVAKQAVINIAADRAEQTAVAKTPSAVEVSVAVLETYMGTKPSNNSATLFRALEDFKRMRAKIDIDADVASLSEEDRQTLNSEIDLAYDWLRLVGAASPTNRNTRSKQLVGEVLLLVKQLTDKERKQLKTRLMEKYQWFRAAQSGAARVEGG
ncbi:ParB-like chromosome segregation protein Spo0J [Bradyrhizobium liaoningense]